MNDFPTRIPVEVAQQLVIDICSARKPGSEVLGLQECSGRVLSMDVPAPCDLPRFANSAMDGFALRAADLPASGERRLRLIGTCLAGDQASALIRPGECLRITTGARMPMDADTVVIKEHATVEDDSIIIKAGERGGSHVRSAGEDFRAGESVARGGQRISPARSAALASAGLGEVSVTRRPTVRILTTGNELILPGTRCGPAQIYNSNGYSLAAMLGKSGIQPVTGNDRSELPFGHVRDDRAQLRNALLDAEQISDVIITSGGVSAGEADYLSGLVAELGKIHFWKVRMRPGMPFLFGEIGQSLVFCLPGNPVSTMATFLCLVQPGLDALEGLSEAHPRLWPARLGADIQKRHDRAEFLRAVREIRDDGTLWVTPVDRQGSSMIRGLAEANALILVPEATQDLQPGDIVKILPLNDAN